VAEVNRDMLSNIEVSAFCAQIAMVMRAGIPVSEGVAIMAEDVRTPHGKLMLEGIAAELETGSPFYMALKAAGSFPRYVVDMTEIGEKTGKLDDVMNSLGAYYEREEAVSKNIRNAITYPMVMVAMMLVVITVLIVNVLPVFNEVFIQLGSEMSEFSVGMMEAGQVIARYSYVFVGILALIFAGILALKYTKAGAGLWRRFKLSFFVTKKPMEKLAAGRFASVMAMTLSSGLDVDQSLDMAQQLVDNPGIAEKISKCRGLMAAGSSFSTAIVDVGLFSGIYARMISVGFKTGSVDTVMTRIAEMFDEEVQTRIGNTIAVLEPTLVAVLSVIMGTILLSVMAPLMGIMTSIG